MYVISQATAYPGAQNGACRSHMRTRALFAVFARLAILYHARGPHPAVIPDLVSSITRLSVLTLLAAGAPPASPTPLAAGAPPASPTLPAAGAPPASPTLLAAGAPLAVLAPLHPQLCSRPVLRPRVSPRCTPPLCSRQALSARRHPVSQPGPRAPFSSIRPAWSRRFLHGCARCSRSRRDTERWRLCCDPGR